MNATEERASAMRSRAEDWRKEGLIAAEQEREIAEAFAVPVRSYGVLAQAVFFLLTCIGAGAFYGLAEVFDLPSGFLTAIAAIAAAEALIRKKRWFHTGVEAALWLAAMLALVSTLPRTGSRESLLVIAAAIAIAGVRVRNPLFSIAVGGLIVAWAEGRFNLGTIAAIVIASVAMLALLREWARPSSEWLWIALVVTMPIAGRIAADRAWLPFTTAMYAAFGAVALALAIRKRHHALFVASAIALGIAIVEVARRVALANEVKLAAGGTLLLALAWIAARVLRDRTSGWVVTPAKLTPADDVLQTAGSLLMARAQSEDAKVAASEARPEGDGGFGGAGATGKF